MTTRYLTLAQLDAELLEAQKRRTDDLDLIHRGLLDVAAMDYRIEVLLEKRTELTGRQTADA